MEINHQLIFKSNEEPKLLLLLENSGLKVNAVDLANQNGKSISILITESNTIWPLVYPFLKSKNILHSIETTFSEEEVLEAEWIRIVNVVEHGYPQPMQAWVTSPNNYDVLCKRCGIFQQTKPFRIAKEPKLGNNSFMSLIWTGDTLFAVPEVINVLTENQIKGFETWEAIIYKENIPAKSIIQIYITNITSPGLLDSEKLIIKSCPECDVTKYGYHRDGKMRYRINSIPTGIDIVRTYEWFGSGHFAFREIFVSNRLARVIIENNWMGLNMKVVEVI